MNRALTILCVLSAYVSAQNISFEGAPPPPIYKIKYPVDNEFATTVVNYKDTLELSWYPYSYSPENPPTIQIQCWNRNASDPSKWFSRESDFSKNVTTITDKDTTSYNVSMQDYKPYDPCRFILIDSVNATLAQEQFQVISNAVQILVDDGAKAKSWSGENEAPVATEWKGNSSAPAVGVNSLLAYASVACAGIMMAL